MYVCGGYYVTILIYINETYNSFPSKITDRYLLQNQFLVYNGLKINDDTNFFIDLTEYQDARYKN